MLPHGAENAKIRVSEVEMVPALLDALPERGRSVVGEDQNTIANASRPIRVLLADDHTMFRQGLASILASSYGGMEVVAKVANDEEALRLTRDLESDVVIMQVQMPFERAKQTLRELGALPEPPKVVIVTMFESPKYVRGLTGVGPAPTC
jgi:CheY-like chemotaxis protein